MEMQERGTMDSREEKEKSILFRACNEANGGRQSRELTLRRRTRDLSSGAEGLKRRWREVKGRKGRQTDRNRMSLSSVNTEIYLGLKAFELKHDSVTTYEILLASLTISRIINQVLENNI